MNNLTSRQRKLVYVCGIVVLLIPIILLGLPAGEKENSGGELAKLRERYDLGESTLGNVDPSSSAMNLVLLGLRGPAASILRLEAEELQKTKNWGKLRAIVDTITLLQPHYVKVWQFEGWNLAYNVSQAWDGTEDRYYWVKEGIKFQDKGIQRNRKNADLVWHTARLVGWKVGTADEWRYFRKYFMVDPDRETFNGGPDPAINPETKDNFLVSKTRYTLANEIEVNEGQRVQARELFRQYPARAQIEYAARMQKEGRFDDTTRLAWEQAHDDWVNGFGREEFVTTSGRNDMKARYSFEDWFSTSPEFPNGNTEEMRVKARENYPDMSETDAMMEQRFLTEIPMKTVNYAYWRQLTMTEKDEKMLSAHRFIYNGKQLFKEGKTSPRGENGDEPSLAQTELESGMKLFDEMFKAMPELADDSLIEEALVATQYWKYIHRLNGEDPPDKFPLYEIWNDHQSIHEMIKRKFRQETAPER